MLTNEEKTTVLGQIAGSSTFQNSPASTALLRYLVKESITGTHLKEGIIEMEFYGSAQGSDESNPRVRVNMYHLRKRLKKYYENEGQSDRWRLTIEKGQYNVRFETQEQKRPEISRQTITIALLSSVILIVGILLVLQLLPRNKPLLWKAYLNNGYPTTLYIGDAYGMLGNTPTGELGWIRNFRINNHQDFYEMIDRNPELKEVLEPANFSYINSMGAFAARDLSGLFSCFSETFDIRLASSTSIADIKEGNAVCIGRIPNDDNFIYSFNNANLYCELEGYWLKVRGHPELPDTSIHLHTGANEPFDLALVSRIAGPRETEQFIFLSNHEIGIMATVEYFTDTDALKEFTKKHLDGASHFTAVYRVYGKDRVNVDFEEVLVVPF